VLIFLFYTWTIYDSAPEIMKPLEGLGFRVFPPKLGFFFGVLKRPTPFSRVLKPMV
jgi:hypothetical protein